MDTTTKLEATFVQIENQYYDKLNDAANSDDIISLLCNFDDKPGCSNARPFRMQVMLDCGALVLDKSNHEFAKAWLSRSNMDQISAAVYFEGNSLVKLDRRGTITPFHSEHPLERYVIYLDDHHTRGTDLKIPAGIRACVTLGRDLTRDKLFQACMRMRHLGRDHALLFLASSDVHQQLTVLSKSITVQTEDILKWSASNSQKFVETHLVLWASNGTEYWRHEKICNGAFDAVSSQQCNLVEPWNLEELYGSQFKSEFISDIIQRRMPLGLHPAAACIYNHILEHAGSVMANAQVLDEQQEREIVQEVEEQHEISRPMGTSPHVPKLHPNLISLVRGGSNDVRHLEPLLPFYLSFGQTSVDSLIRKLDWRVPIFVTKQFNRAVKLDKSANLDEFQREPIWILRIKKTKDILVLTPFEVDRLWNEILKSKHVSLSIYAPRLTVKSIAMDRYPAFTIHLGAKFDQQSRMQELQLMIFSGSTMFADAQEEQDYEEFLGLCAAPRTPFQQEQFMEDKSILRTGFVNPGARKNINPKLLNCWFLSDPTAAVLEILRIRDHQTFNSHVGSLLHRSQKSLQSALVVESEITELPKTSKSGERPTKSRTAGISRKISSQSLSSNISQTAKRTVTTSTRKGDPRSTSGEQKRKPSYIYVPVDTPAPNAFTMIQPAFSGARLTRSRLRSIPSTTTSSDHYIPSDLNHSIRSSRATNRLKRHAQLVTSYPTEAKRKSTRCRIEQENVGPNL